MFEKDHELPNDWCPGCETSTFESASSVVVERYGKLELWTSVIRRPVSKFRDASLKSLYDSPRYRIICLLACAHLPNVIHRKIK